MANPSFSLDSDGDTSPDHFKLSTTATSGVDGFPTASVASQRTISLTVVDDNPQTGNRHFRIAVLASTGSGGGSA